ncbi:MAG: cupin domain-containing protein [Candidatus Omnitrophica bacterium]|nr:cupin domain-containing protein [Candidatus Omnitrophota bacterium]MDD5670288.1 cupin domain-containing protein [Candidatus Omnitrophota bacterium]
MIKKGNNPIVEVRKNMRGGPGEVTIRHYFKPEEIHARTRLCAELRLPPGAGIGLHEHSGEDEIFIIQSGQGVVTDDGKETEVVAGDVIVTGQGASHAIRNTGGTDLIVTAVILLYPS